MYYIINIGSNLGDRRHNLSRAMAAVMRRYGEIEMSHVVETDPRGYESPNKFLNVAIMFRSDDQPLDVLAELQEIERSISDAPHRNADGSYADRILDIDMIAADDLTMNTEQLTLPHPRLAERDFFLVPLEEIAPAWRHPLTGLTATEMLSTLPASNPETPS